MGHQESYRHNESYAEFLENWDEGFYAKYADTLAFSIQNGKSLDVGCGTGQVVHKLIEKGIDAFGVDVSEPNLERAVRISDQCRLYDGRQLPFDDNLFDSAGALNVLEHVEEPEDFIREIIRVVKPGGRLVLSSPNFYRVFGFRDYHPRMRGIRMKMENARRLLEKWKSMRANPGNARFDRMNPIIRQEFQPDDDAIVATNAMEMEFFVEKSGCRIQSVSCTDRYVWKPLDVLLNFTPLRYVMFNSFLVAEKK